MYDKYLSWSPYNYSLTNPIILSDPNGKDPYRKYLGSIEQVKSVLEQNQGKSYWDISKIFATSNVRYIYTKEGGFLDLRHFFAAAEVSSKLGKNTAIIAGELEEKRQEFAKSTSANDPEDRPSNLQGANFGEKNKEASNVAENFKNFIEELKPVDPSDPSIASDKAYIPYDEYSIPLPSRVSYEPYHGEDPDYLNQVRRGEIEP